MKAEIVLVGTELLLGHIRDTNGAFLAGRLAQFGIDLYHIQIVGDNPGRMEEVFRQALQRSDFLLISGGLGPTADDLTREVVAKILEERLEFRPEAWAMVEDYFSRRGKACSLNNQRQAMYTKSMEILPNKQGTAPGIWSVKDKKIIAALPGVSGELEEMFMDQVIPRLQRSGRIKQTLVSRIIRLVGIGEAAMEEAIKDLLVDQTNPTIAPYAGNHETRISITAKAEDVNRAKKLIKPVFEIILQRLGDYCYGFDQDTLPEIIAKMLLERGLILSTAESCTGGLLSALLTGVPGISGCYAGGVVAYDNKVKTEFLGVSPDTLACDGAVSERTAKEMAEGIRRRIKSDLGIGITGIAGPGGGTPQKPVGLVYISLAVPEGEVITEKHRFPWGREGNRQAAAKAALVLLWKYLRNQNNRTLSQ